MKDKKRDYKYLMMADEPESSSAGLSIGRGSATKSAVPV